MNLGPENEHEERAFKMFREIETGLEKEIGPLSSQMKQELRLEVLKGVLDRCSDEDLLKVRDGLARHPVSSNTERGALDLVNGMIALRQIQRQ